MLQSNDALTALLVCIVSFVNSTQQAYQVFIFTSLTRHLKMRTAARKIGCCVAWVVGAPTVEVPQKHRLRASCWMCSLQVMRFFWKATPDSMDHQGVKCKIMRPVSLCP